MLKGDLGGLSMSGRSDIKLHDAFQTRAKTIGLTHYTYHATPTVFWDIFGVSGHPVRTTVSEMGPVLLSRLLGLTDAQEGVINIAFRLADEEGLALLDLKDLQSMLVWMGENREAIALRMVIFPWPQSGPFNAIFWCWKTRVQLQCLVNLHWIWPT